MKSIKYFLPLIVLFLSIGYAATNVTLSITGDVITMSDIEDFDVYISDIKVDDKSDIWILKNKLSFEYTLQKEQTVQTTPKETITYEITNNSENFDANINIECNEPIYGTSDTTLRVTNKFGEETTSTTTIPSKSSQTGKTTLIISEPIVETEVTFTCTITAEPVERKELGTGETPEEVEIYKIKYFDSDNSNYIDIGDVVDIAGEKFNIIRSDEDNITMLAQYNLGPNHRQTAEQTDYYFTTEPDWIDQDEKDLDIQNYNGEAKNKVNKYTETLKTKLEIETITGDLISKTDLISLGCKINGYAVNCDDSIYVSWIYNKQSYFTKTIYLDDLFNRLYTVYYIQSNDTHSILDLSVENYPLGIRPTVTIPTSVFKELTKTPKETLISFELVNTKYYAEPGMTWGEWVNSTYNVSNFLIGDNNYIASADNEYLILNNFAATYVKSNHVIENRKNIYYLEPK